MAKISDRGVVCLPDVGDVCDGGGTGKNLRALEESWPKSDAERGALVSFMRKRLVGCRGSCRSVFYRMFKGVGGAAMVARDQRRERDSVAPVAEGEIT
jgi:hypothetical protein